MSNKLVVYTDPMWAVTKSGQIDPKLADIEQSIFGNSVRLHFGLYEDGDFVRQGLQFQQTLCGADAVVIYRTQITPEVVEILKPTCKLVARQGVGFDNLNVPLLVKHGIFGLNVPDYCVEEVSNHTIAMLLALERKLCIQNERLKGGYWNIYEGGYPRRLKDLTVGIIGFGRIGRATSRKAQVFYGSIIAYDPYVHSDLMIGYGVSKRHHLNDLLAESDVVILHALLDDTTKFIINAKSIKYMKTDAILVNTARGNLVKPEAVLDALENSCIGGYASDVFSPENPNEHLVNKKIMLFENVVVTSHRAFLSKQSEQSLRKRVAEEIIHVLTTGEPPRFGRQA